MGWTVRSSSSGRERDFLVCISTQTGSEAHRASAKIGSGDFLRGQSGQGVELTINPPPL